VSHSPSVPAGGVNGGTWSKNPPFSSWVTNRTVCAHTAGFVGGLAVPQRRVAVQAERLQVAGRVGALTRLVAELIEDRVALPADELAEDVRVRETTHAGQRAEVVVKGPVLLHQDHHMLDVAQARRSRRRGRLVDQPGLRVGQLAHGRPLLGLSRAKDTVGRWTFW